MEDGLERRGEGFTFKITKISTRILMKKQTEILYIQTDEMYLESRRGEGERE